MRSWKSQILGSLSTGGRIRRMNWLPTKVGRASNDEHRPRDRGHLSLILACNSMRELLLILTISFVVHFHHAVQDNNRICHDNSPAHRFGENPSL